MQVAVYRNTQDDKAHVSTKNVVCSYEGDRYTIFELLVCTQCMRNDHVYHMYAKAERKQGSVTYG